MQMFLLLIIIKLVLAHPFVGQHADSDFIEYEDGGLAVRLRPIEMHSTKYDHLISTDIQLRPKEQSL